MIQTFFRCLFILILSVFVFSNANANQLDNKEWKRQTEKMSFPLPGEVIIEETDQPTGVDQPPGSGDYQRSRKRESRQVQTRRKQSNSSSISMRVIKIGLYIVLGLLFLFVVIRILRKKFFLKAAKPKLKTDYDVENPEVLIKSELENELELALASGDYSRCMRYHFLLMLEDLQQMGHILWHPYRTNGEYLHELLDFKDVEEVSALTYLYEYYWYGGYALSQTRYQELEKRFGHLKSIWNRP